ncbi:MAG: cell wall-binding repeat-containing protein [Coriobacteriia bacterium]|nr:cell wall-binding repeat-containing protein [Coriobacteriia bacterium]
MHRTRSISIAVVAACIALAMLPTAAFAISRDVVLARGMAWVNYTRSVKGKKVTGVPYSQSKWALENGSPVPTSTPDPSIAGYRTDCSGFASLCWNLRDSKGRPYSESTSSFGAKGSKKYFQITKAQLVPGDMVLASAVWGAPGPHAIIFDGWVDAAQTQFWAMEQTSSSSHDGTILHARSWADAVARKFRPYRYADLDAPYSDVEENISAPDPYQSAAAACDAAYPVTGTVTVPTMVIASGAVQGDQVTAASLAGAAGGPVLLVSRTSLPASTTAEIKRLKPKHIYVLGSSDIINDAVVKAIAALGPTVTRLAGHTTIQVASSAIPYVVAEDVANKHAASAVYLSTAHSISDALAVAPVLAKTGRPLLFVDKDSMRSYTARALKATKIKRLILLGGTGSISAKQQKALGKLRYKVSRIAGANSSKTSLAIAAHALSLNVGFQWKSMGVTSTSSCVDSLAWAWSNGTAGFLYLTTPTKKLDSAVRSAAIVHRTFIGKARVYGGAGAVSDAARKTLATALRSGK